MKKQILTGALLLLASLILLPITHAETAGPFGDYEPHDFLSDYSKIKPEGEGSKAFVYRNPDIDRSQYKKIMIDRIKVFFREDSKYKGIDPAELKELVDYFHDAIVKALSDAYEIVREPASDVVRLRIALTDLEPNKPEASVVTLVVPFIWLGEAGAGVVQDDPGSTPFLGEATVEMEALDSVTNQQIGAYIEERTGKKYNWTHGIGTAAKDYLKAYSTWAYTKQAMDHWAQFIRQRMDAAHGVESKAKQ
ncbi:MAG: DUF3313 domain-containing protein [bacterium]|nr:DUF3313 domain-containing protein [bacterium]